MRHLPSNFVNALFPSPVFVIRVGGIPVCSFLLAARIVSSFLVQFMNLHYVVRIMFRLDIKLFPHLAEMSCCGLIRLIVENTSQSVNGRLRCEEGNIYALLIRRLISGRQNFSVLKEAWAGQMHSTSKSCYCLWLATTGK